MLYEVVFYGGPGTADTVYVVRAPDFLAAVDLASASSHLVPDMVYEMGSDNSPHSDTPNILFGPFEANKAWDYGWRRWSRKVMADGTTTDEWEELERVI